MNEEMILFDFDDTLFSKEKYKNALANNLGNLCGVPGGEILKLEEEYFQSLERSDNFRIENLLSFLENKFEIKIKLDDFTSDNLKLYSGSLFPESIEVLEELKDDFILGIYSQGFQDLQRLKINSSGLENYFDEDIIFIDRDKTNTDFIKKLPDGVTIIDDKKEVIERLATEGRFNLIWINRKNNEKFENSQVETVSNLKEVKPLLIRKNQLEQMVV